jgi:ferric-dicitrate binding protein FerR (iron transport regulator)
MVTKREEAVEWFVLLRRGVVTHDACKAYEQWRRDPANEAAMAELRELWQGLEGIRGRLPRLDERAAARERPAIARSVRVAALMSVAASLVLAVMLDLDSAWWTSLDWWSR